MHEETRATRVTRSASKSSLSFSARFHYVNLARLRRKQGLQIMTAKASEAIPLLDDEAGHARVFELRQQLRPAIVRARSDLLDHLDLRHVTALLREACGLPLQVLPMLWRGDLRRDRNLLGSCRRRLTLGHDDRSRGCLLALEGAGAEPPQSTPIADALLLGVLTQFHALSTARLYLFVNVWHYFLVPIPHVMR